MLASKLHLSHSAIPEESIMAPAFHAPSTATRSIAARLASLSLAIGLLVSAGCAPAISTTAGTNNRSAGAPNPDPRVGLRAGKFDAATAAWNLRLVSTTQPTEKFMGVTNSDLAFLG